MKKVFLFVVVAMAVASFSSCSKDKCMCRVPVVGTWEDMSSQADNAKDCEALGSGVLECKMR